jgi:hypothetical protein
VNKPLLILTSRQPQRDIRPKTVLLLTPLKLLRSSLQMNLLLRDQTVSVAGM